MDAQFQTYFRIYIYIYIHDLIYNQFFVYDMKTWFQILNVAFKETWE